MSFLFVQFLTGLASASSLFLVASGLSLIFGVTRVVNFAHGSFYMLGAFCGYSAVGLLAPVLGDAFGFWIAVPLTAAAVAVLGAALEMTVLRRIYGAPELFQLLATFGILLVLADATLAVWGPEDLLGPRAPGLAGAVQVFGQAVPTYDLFLIGVGPVVLGLLWFCLQRTRWGVQIRAATENRELTAALGINQRRLFTSVFAVGAGLAGLAGALELPRHPASLGMDLGVIVEVFVVTVVGGMGSIPGAFVAALLIGQLQAFGILAFPEITIVLLFLFMAAVLIVRPWGLLGRPEAPAAARILQAEAPLRPLPASGKAAALAIALLLAAMPLVAGPYMLSVATEIIVFALFAASLHFLTGIGGIVSFGHAAGFGLGAYGAALAVRWLEAGMPAGLAAGVALAAVGTGIFGAFCIRLSGVYLAMLTLAFAQICYAVAFQWYDVTGGDNGLIGIWPPRWASSPETLYWLALLLCGAGAMALRHMVHAPLGLGMRACRDSPLRAEASAIDRRGIRWAAFTLAGMAAGLAGAFYAFFKGSVFPDALGVGVSVDGLVMMLLGGIGTLSGPLVGAAAYKATQVELAAATDFWRALLGLGIVLLVVLFPRGIAGQLQYLWYRWVR
ncbi:branched-chain amino acid transport system permease protein [Constrictibacter sp. MBR-5]|jgi:branched-chain amino acid transport system permease protein|uniref:ABC transporter permease n=1 Tax=Constrictibacter sp. MBR-5 TaxID=3156467 RepID=UPI00339AAE1B